MAHCDAFIVKDRGQIEFFVPLAQQAGIAQQLLLLLSVEWFGQVGIDPSQMTTQIRCARQSNAGIRHGAHLWNRDKLKGRRYQLEKRPISGWPARSRLA